VRLDSSWLLLSVLLFTACYQQPAVLPARPLLCASSQAAGECPKGFACIADRVCAPVICERNEDCPATLVCTSRGCLLLPDGGEPDAMGGLLPGGLPDGGRPGPDAILLFDGVSSPSTPDAGPGGVD
jgi:hypothetical protein